MVRYLPDGIWNNFSRQYKEERKLLFFTFVLGCTLYLRMIVQWLANPDGVWQGLVYKPGYAWEDMLGRMGLGMFNRFKGYYQFPTLQTLFCIFTAALTAVLLCSLLEIKKHPWDYIAGGLVVCSPSLCSTLTYYCTADAYLLAFLFSVLFVWCLAKGDTWKSYAVAVFLLAASACIYQAYIGSAITLCLLYLLLNIIRNTVPPRNLLGKFFRFLTAGACASALYLVSYKLVCRWRGITPVADRGFDSMGHIPLGRIPTLIGQAYRYFFSYYFTDKLYNNTWMGRGRINMLAAVFLLILLAGYMLKKQSSRRGLKLCAAAGILLIPMAFMSITVMAPDCSIEDVTGCLT